MGAVLFVTVLAGWVALLLIFGGVRRERMRRLALERRREGVERMRRIIAEDKHTHLYSNGRHWCDRGSGCTDRSDR
jgi:hypothetical protein